MQRPRRRSKLLVWDGVGVAAAWQGAWNRAPSDASPSPLIFVERSSLQDHLMPHLLPEHHSEPGAGPGSETRGRTRERA